MNAGGAEAATSVSMGGGAGSARVVEAAASVSTGGVAVNATSASVYIGCTESPLHGHNVSQGTNLDF